MAELRAISEGMKIAQSVACKKLIVESDSQVAINFLNKISVGWSDLEAVLEEVWSQVDKFDFVEFRYIPRWCNAFADFLAKFACSVKASESWVFHIPNWLCNLVHVDLSFSAQVA